MGLAGRSVRSLPDAPDPNLRRGPPQIIDYRKELQSVLSAPSAFQSRNTAEVYHESRVLKPLAGLGYSGEMRDLAEVIARDILVANPNVAWTDIIGLENPKRLAKEAVVYPVKYPELFRGILSPWKGRALTKNFAQQRAI